MFTAVLEIVATLLLVLGAAFFAEYEALRIGDRRARRATSGIVLVTIVLLMLVMIARPLG